MIGNFKSMPTLLKFMTGHALFCITLFALALAPLNQFEVGGRKVTYAEWISSGIGPLLALVGLAMAVAGLLFLRRNGLGRVIYLSCFGGLLTVPNILTGEYLAASFGLAVGLGVGVYFFGNKAVREYFASNNSFKPKPLRGSA